MIYSLFSIIIDIEIPADEDIVSAQNAILDVVKNKDYTDKAGTADVLVTNLKGGVFTLQVKFWVALGTNISKSKSDAYVNIKQRLDQEKIALVTPTSISIEKN